MTLEIDATGPGAPVRVTGEVDAQNAYDLYLAALDQAADGHDAITLNLTGVTFIDSVGLSMLIRARDDLRREHHAQLTLHRPSQRVLDLLNLTGLHDVFDIA